MLAWAAKVAEGAGRGSPLPRDVPSHALRPATMGGKSPIFSPCGRSPRGSFPSADRVTLPPQHPLAAGIIYFCYFVGCSIFGWCRSLNERTRTPGLCPLKLFLLGAWLAGGLLLGALAALLWDLSLGWGCRIPGA